MGWTASYQVVRDRILDDTELAGLAKLARALIAKPWDGEPFRLVVTRSMRPDKVIARGWIKLPMDSSSRDPARLCDALDKVQALFPSSLVRAVDDHDQLGWDPRNGCFQFGGRDRRPLVDETPDDTWQALFEAVPAPPPPLREGLAALVEAAGQGLALNDHNRKDERLVREAFDAMIVPEANLEPLKKLLAACDPDVVARIGLSIYPSIQHVMNARDAVGHAFQTVTDVPALAELFAAAWSQPQGTYYYGDMWLPNEFAAKIAAQPLVRDRLLACVDLVEAGKTDKDIDQRCAEKSAVLLGRSADDTATRRLVAIVRKWRDQPQPHAMRFFVVQPALEGLAYGKLPTVAATLMLALDGSTCTYRGDYQAIVGASAADFELARPILRRMLTVGVGLPPALEAIETIGPRAADFAEAIAPYLAYPHLGVRGLARRALTAIGHTPPSDEPPMPAPEQLVLHPNQEVRHEALRAIHARKDKAVFMSLAIAEQVDATLRIATGSSSLPFSWWDWKDLLPPKVVQGRPNDRVAWARSPDGQKALGAQRMLEVVAPIADLTASKVAGQLPPQRLTLDSATRSALAAREREIFGA